MQEMTVRKIRIGSGLVLGVLTGLVALLFLIETADLYYSGLAAGGDIYSREIVGRHLTRPWRCGWPGQLRPLSSRSNFPRPRRGKSPTRSSCLRA